MTDMTTQELIMNMAAVDMIDIMEETQELTMKRIVYPCHTAIDREIGLTIVVSTTTNIPAALELSQTLTHSSRRHLKHSNRTRITMR